jgi:hypothetical protein
MDNLRKRFLKTQGEPMSALWRKWVFAERISLPNTPISAVDVKFRTLIARNLPRSADRFTLSLECLRYPIRTSFSDAPLAVPRNNMLAFHGHSTSPDCIARSSFKIGDGGQTF